MDLCVPRTLPSSYSSSTLCMAVVAAAMFFQVDPWAEVDSLQRTPQ